MYILFFVLIEINGCFRDGGWQCGIMIYVGMYYDVIEITSKESEEIVIQQKEIKRKNYNEQWKRELQIEKEMEQTIKTIKTITVQEPGSQIKYILFDL